MNVVRLNEDHTTTLNGRRFFLIGARHMPEGGTQAKLAEAGFNGFRWSAFGTESSQAADLPQPPEDLYFWAYIFDRAVFDRCRDYQLQLESLADRLKDHPRFLCYENYNEVAMRWGETDTKAGPSELIAGSRRLREIDPDHPIWLAHCCGRTVETLRAYNPCTDILGCNPYPVQPPGMKSHYGVRPDGRMFDCPDQTLHGVGRYIEKMLRLGEQRMPVWMLIQAMANEHWFDPQRGEADALDPTKVLYPTYDEMRFMTYDAIICGATGLAFSMYRTPVDSQAWRDVSRLVGELRLLHDVLCAPKVDEPIEISYTDLGFTIWDGVRISARRIGGSPYILAANTAFDRARAAIRMPCLVGPQSAVVVNEDRQIPIVAGCLQDDFDPFAVHVYRMDIEPN